MDKIQSALYNMLEKKQGFSDAELKRYAIIKVMGYVTCLYQCIFMLIYLALWCIPLILTFFASTIIILACLQLLEIKKMDLAGGLITLSVVLAIIADDYFIGNKNLSILYIFAVLLINVMIPYKNRIMQLSISAGLSLLMVFLYFYGLGHHPFFQLSRFMRGFSTMNIILSSTSVTFLVFLYRFVQNYVIDYRERKLEELETKAHRDSLTKMYNRHYANDYLETLKGCENERVIYMAIVDIDDFKKVNDTYGHDAGDTALRDVSSIMKKNLRKSDLVIRWGGEEFVILLHDVECEDDARILFDKIRLIIEGHTIVHCEHAFKVTVTMGVCRMDMQDIDKCVDHCDKKLYHGKNSGKNMVVI